MNDVAQEVRDIIHEADVSADRDIAMVLRRRRQLVREIAGNGVYALTEVWIERFARLETRFLVGREPILGSEAHRRAALVLIVPILGGPTGVVIELH